MTQSAYILFINCYCLIIYNISGFVLSDPSLLPSTREYNKIRGSKVYIKQLGSQRDIDAEELLWNV